MIHGSKGNPNSHWFPWLKQKLESLGQTVFALEFPNPPEQSLDSWMEVFDDYLSKVDEDTIFVGHSLGPSFILSILEKLDLPKPLKACFFVSGFVGGTLGVEGMEEYDEINKSFTDKEFNWSKIKSNCKKFVCFMSDNDPYVPLSRSKELASRLEAEEIVVSDAGHFQEKSGIKEFPQLLNRVKESL